MNASMEHLCRALAANMASTCQGTTRAAFIEAHWRDFEPKVRQFLRSIREPSDDMINAGRSGLNRDIPHDRDCIEVWHDMIDEALK